MVEIYKQAAEELFRVKKQSSILRFPQYFNKDTKPVRISEQESKIILTNLFFINKIPFAVEVPTVEKFNFSGSEGEGKSAHYDFAIYEVEQYHTIKYAIELKALTPEYKQIHKDIKKFARSNFDFIWFHTLVKADKNTYKSIFDNLNKAIISEQKDILGKHKWDFVILNLKNKELFYISKTISKDAIFQFHNIEAFDKLL